MTTVLVANRGEIAVRVFRTARRMGLRTVAVYSDADTGAPHVRAADASVRIGPAPASESYLRRDAILEAARESGAELIHPGYGFLAEDDRFAADCENAGITFVGPPSDVLRSVGDKASARALAVAAGVPVLPGYTGADQSDAALLDAARAVAFPVMVKPAGGGGGKGMAVVRTPEELADALASARRIARAAFGDDRLILERYLDHPRHVEVQVLADAHGNVVHLGERDCSLQRRHQKILEESPAANLGDDLRSRLHDSAVAFARHAGYVGAGTCEFLVGSDGGVGFIEMNARLQVEHPVTEIVTGLDLVELQFRVAMGERLPLSQDEVRADGHAIEVRVYAEDADAGFLPQTGRVEHVRWPPDTRVDAGIEEGTEISPHYDPLLAKLIVSGPTRANTLDVLHQALSSTELLGVRTNLTFLNLVSREPAVVHGEVTTDWLDGTSPQRWTRTDPSGAELAVAIAAAAEADRVLDERIERDPWSGLGPWRAGGRGRIRVVVRPSGVERTIAVEGDGPYDVEQRWSVERGRRCHEWVIDGRPAAAARGEGAWFVWLGWAAYDVPVGVGPRSLVGAGPARLDSPLPGRVVAVRVAAGQRVSQGAELVVVEAMKMEHAIRSPTDGTVRAVLCAEGDQVDRGQSLVDLEPD